MYRGACICPSMSESLPVRALEGRTDVVDVCTCGCAWFALGQPNLQGDGGLPGESTEEVGRGG